MAIAHDISNMTVGSTAADSGGVPTITEPLVSSGLGQSNYGFMESKALQPGDQTSIHQLLRVIPNDPSNMRANRVFQVDWELIKLLQTDLPNDGAVTETTEVSTKPGRSASENMIPTSTLRAVHQALRRISKKSRIESWSRPQNALASHFNKQGGWQAFVLKVHQAIAALVILDESRGTVRNRPNSIMCNIVETLSLWTAIQRVISDDDELSFNNNYGDELYGDYHNTIDSSRTTEFSFTEGGSAGSPSSPSRVVPTDEEDATAQLFVSMPGGVWSGMFPAASPETGMVIPAGDAESPTGPSNYYMEEHKKGLLVIDADYLSMAVTSTGRFDAYLWAILCEVLKEAKLLFRVQPPAILSHDWDMCGVRAQHAYRVFRDATGPYKLTKSKYEWYVTLLTSGSLRAVQDTFHDLANEIWHAQFSKGDVNATKRLEKLLIALLGHPNDMVRSQATVFLNNLYDSHDWQQDFPFLPIIRCVGDRFTIEFTVNDDADHAKGESPQGVFLILSAPSMECSADFEVYSYHTLHWRPLSSLTEKHGAKYRRFLSRRAGGKFTWIGTCDFGSYPRCGFYDWRVVRSDPSTGSWVTVQSTVAEIKQTFESSFSLGNLDGSDEASSEVHLFRSRNLWPELGRLHDATQQSLDLGMGDDFKTLPLQGRFIVHPRDARKEQIHELVVDQYGARFAPDGKLLERGSFAKVSQDLALHKEQGVSTVFLSGALARDNGEARYTPSGEVVYEREDASPFAVTCTPCLRGLIR
eukprot:Gregarina_sp_Poly_1__2855@NODE_1798_length_3309_cov_273_995065_g302_i2_p1_GENE_NODE_1798_length_3309_cov_273_995065_g302_i2NODE_1798_length_3309_cov_273_995065_g302_i2_p1_ORF_typecomplete_len755_score95_61_NODE_1798_length_3309_cov_273_995065_g302_i29583222